VCQLLSVFWSVLSAGIACVNQRFDIQPSTISWRFRFPDARPAPGDPHAAVTVEPIRRARPRRRCHRKQLRPLHLACIPSKPHPPSQPKIHVKYGSDKALAVFGHCCILRSKSDFFFYSRAASRTGTPLSIAQVLFPIRHRLASLANHT